LSLSRNSVRMKFAAFYAVRGKVKTGKSKWSCPVLVEEVVRDTSG
jgi:hypothetical protein